MLNDDLHFRVAGDIIAGVVTKCLNARPKTKEKGIDIILMYIEVEKQDVVQVHTAMPANHNSVLISN